MINISGLTGLGIFLKNGILSYRKIFPLIIVFYAIFNIYTSVLGYMTFYDHQIDLRNTFIYRKNSFVANLVISCLLLLISSILFYSAYDL